MMLSNKVRGSGRLRGLDGRPYSTCRARLPNYLLHQWSHSPSVGWLVKPFDDRTYTMLTTLAVHTCTMRFNYLWCLPIDRSKNY